MAQKAHSLSHTKWYCFITLCSPLSIDEKSFIINIEVVQEKYFIACVVIKELHFWAEGYYVSTVGLNKATIKKDIQD